MKKFFVSAFITAATICATTAAQAHFQLIYSPEINIEKAGDQPVKLIFWHPMANDHAMDMGKPVGFASYFKGKKTDLSSSLKETTFKGAHNTAKAYDGVASFKRNGDYHLVLTPEPYLEESEDIYIQQITKVTYNKGGLPTDWAEPVGLPTEIQPLQKPYGVIAGSSFSAIVLSEGKPAAGIEIEIEYMPVEPDMKTGSVPSDKGIEIPGGAIAMITDQNGKFTFTVPTAGYWGFAALGSGPKAEYNGKELSQDAVLWIKAHEMGR